MTPTKLTKFERVKKLKDKYKKLYEKMRIELIDEYNEKPNPPDGWHVTVTEYTSERILGVREIKDRSTKLYESLTRNGIIYESNETRLTVKPTDD